MKLRCSRCKKYKEEKDFYIQAKGENNKNWVTEKSVRTQNRYLRERGGHHYLCKECLSEWAKEKLKEKKKDKEKWKKILTRQKRYRVKEKYIRKGYSIKDAEQMAEKEVPYLWNEEGYEWSEEKGDWVKVS